MDSDFSPDRRATLRALCDAFFPAITASDDRTGFWSRTASQLQVDDAVAAFIGERVPPPVRVGLLQLLDVLHAQGFIALQPESREGFLEALTSLHPEASPAVAAIKRLILFFAYTLTDSAGRNPNWAVFGYPGPLAAPRPVPKPVHLTVPARDGDVLEADVCVVGSGAGGSVIAATLAARGYQVVVLEAGGYYNEGDFTQQELWAYSHMFWRGGFTTTADGNVSLLAGANLGGGTSVNYMNCVRTPQWMRAEWAREHGLAGVDEPSFDAHLDAILTRLSVNDACSEYNGPHQRLQAGAELLGYACTRAFRNADPLRHDPGVAGYVGFGDQSASRQDTVRTFLLDACEAGAQVVAHCRADRILVVGGRAAGVKGTYAPAHGAARPLVVRAPRVVVAGG